MVHGRRRDVRPIKIVLLLASALVIVAALAVVHWSDQQPHTNHFVNYLVLIGVVAWFVVCMEWWSRR